MHFISPYYITGLVETDGSFVVTFDKNSRNRYGLRAVPKFYITQYQSEESDILFKKIQQYFGCGHITASRDDNCYYSKAAFGACYIFVDHVKIYRAFCRFELAALALVLAIKFKAIQSERNSVRIVRVAVQPPIGCSASPEGRRHRRCLHLR